MERVVPSDSTERQPQINSIGNRYKWMSSTFMWPCIVTNFPIIKNQTKICYLRCFVCYTCCFVVNCDVLCIVCVWMFTATGCQPNCSWQIYQYQLDALISQTYFGNETLHVSDSYSVLHQELFTVHSAMVYVMQVCRQLSSSSRYRTEQGRSEYKATLSFPLGYLGRIHKIHKIQKIYKATLSFPLGYLENS
jgi:hypothetical protein